MTNHPIAAAERERRTQAGAASHGGIQVLDADRPDVAGAPAITHQTTNDPYTPAAQPHDPSGVDAANRLLETPANPAPTAQAPATGRPLWGTLLLALLLIAVAIWLISWLL